MAPTPVLELSTLAPERETVRILTPEHPEGKLYELAVFDDLSLRDQNALVTRGKQLAEAMDADPPFDEEQISQITLYLDELLKIACPVLIEDEVPLEWVKKVKVVEAFTQVSPSLQKAMVETATQATLASSSPASSEPSPAAGPTAG